LEITAKKTTNFFVNNCLGNLSVNFEEKYLGLPVPNGRMKNGKFEPIKERYKKKLNDWTEKYALCCQGSAHQISGSSHSPTCHESL
jgi:hypothetical protein